MAPQVEVGGVTLWAKLKASLYVLPLLLTLSRAILRAQAVQVRCPGNLGLLGVLLAPLFSRARIAKYAGQWSGYPGEPLTYRCQRWLLAHWWRAPVIVYGDWPNQPRHIIPLFNTMLTEADMDRARRAVERAPASGPLRVLFVGRLSAGKNAGVLLEAIRRLNSDNVPVLCTIVGHGPERPALESFCRRHGLETIVRFTGGLPFSAVLDEMEHADVLVLVSETEGWPKVIAEAMAFGLICIASDRGLAPRMLADNRGFVLPTRSPEALACRLKDIAEHDPASRQAMRRAAAQWAQQFTIENMMSQIGQVLSHSWPDLSPQKPGVMHLIDTLDTGGAERVAVSLVNMLPRDRFRVFLCVSRRDGPLSVLVQPDVQRLNLNRRYTFDCAAVWKLAAFLRKHRIMILHAHGPSLFLAVAAKFLAPRTAIIWHVHHGRLAESDPRARLHLLCCRAVWYVITVSQELARYVNTRLRMPACSVAYVPNPVSPPMPAVPPPLLPGTAGRRILCVANLRAEKDHLNLVYAMARVVQEIPDAHLILAGGFPDASTLTSVKKAIDAQQLEPHVTLLGPRRDVAILMAASDIGVLSSSSEGLPVSLIEYGQASMAVVATEVGQCAEVLDNGRAGVLVPPGRPDALAAQLIELLRDPDRRRALGQSLHRHIEERYSAQPVLTQLCSIYETAS
ncbi:MAG: glycosyltransferase [Bryobacterales bacterium]|nr:glycosyltransferase [Bryobacterales bacterium]